MWNFCYLFEIDNFNNEPFFKEKRQKIPNKSFFLLKYYKLPEYKFLDFEALYLYFFVLFINNY